MERPSKKKVVLVSISWESDNLSLYTPRLLQHQLKRAGIDSAIVTVDRRDSRGRAQGALKKILRHSPSLVGFSAYAYNLLDIVFLGRTLKKASPKTKIILGGPHASVLAGKLVRRFSWLDGVIVGEADHRIGPIVDLFLRDDAEGLRLQPGLVYRDGAEILENLSASEPFDLDELPVLSCRRSEPRVTSIPIEVGRGCLCRCSFCATSLFWRNRPFRMRSVGAVVADLRHFARAVRAKNAIISLTHDNITQDRLWLSDFLSRCRRLKTRYPKLRWEGSVRPDQLSGEIVDGLVAGGCVRIFCGMESGASVVQAAVGKKLSVKRGIANIVYALSRGIYATCAFIIGFPFERRQDFEKTIRLAALLRLYGFDIQFSVAAAFPGTRLLEESNLRYTGRHSNVATYADGSVSLLRMPDTEKMIRLDPELFSSFFSIENVEGMPPEFYSFFELVGVRFFVMDFPAFSLLTSSMLDRGLADLCFGFFRYLVEQDSPCLRRYRSAEMGRQFSRYLEAQGVPAGFVESFSRF